MHAVAIVKSGEDGCVVFQMPRTHPGLINYGGERPAEVRSEHAAMAERDGGGGGGIEPDEAVTAAPRDAIQS